MNNNIPVLKLKAFHVSNLGWHRMVETTHTRKGRGFKRISYTRTSFRFVPYPEWAVPGYDNPSKDLKIKMRTKKFARKLFSLHPVKYFELLGFDERFLELADTPENALIAAITAKQMECD